MIDLCKNVRFTLKEKSFFSLFLQAGLVGMTLFVAIGNASPDNADATNNLTKELQALFENTQSADDDDDAGDELDDDIDRVMGRDNLLPSLYPILDASDNGVTTTVDPATAAADEDAALTQDAIEKIRQVFGESAEEEEDEDDTEDEEDALAAKPKQKSKDVDGDSDDEDDEEDSGRAKKDSFEDHLSDSD